MRSASLRRFTLALWIGGCTAPSPDSNGAATPSTKVEVEVDAATDNGAQPSPEPPPPEPTPPPTPPPLPAACTAKQLHAGDHPSMLALDGSHVYFVQGSTLYRIGRTGGEPEVVLEDVAWEELVARDDAVYACRKAPNMRVDVLRLGKDGSPPQVIAQAGTCKLAVLGDHVYFADRDTNWKSWLARAPISGGSGGAVEQLVQVERPFRELVADASHVYFTTESEDVRRFDPSTRTIELLADQRVDTTGLGLTDTHVAWLEHSNLVRLPKHGPRGEPELVANFQNALDFASDGQNLYWASVSNSSWQRLGADGKSLVTYAVPRGASSIVVDGTQVWWTVFNTEGSIFTLDTRGCGDAVLVPTPPRRAIVGPEQEDRLRLGHGDEGRLTVQVRDLSSDESDALWLLESSLESSVVPAGSEGLPPRFSVGDAYRVATTGGVFDAQLEGFEIGSGGEGMLFYLRLNAPGAGEGRALVVEPNGPKLAKLRDVSPDATAIATYLPAVRKAFTDAGLAGDRVLAEHLTVVRGQFPAPHDALISVTVENSNDEGMDYFSALLLGNDAGAISESIFTPEERLDAFTIDYLVDLEADGVDEVGFTSAYYEGSYELLLEWDGADPQTSTLAGDGA
jgi:hypothetical protein